ncbi:MAG: hypothetical protein EOP48_29275, partial [Sphingobacteriales bacterium]
MQVKQTDQEIISQILNGNTSLYGELVKRHERFVFTLALRFTKTREDAEEVAQERLSYLTFSGLDDTFAAEVSRS